MRLLLIVIAIVCFVLAALGTAVSEVELVPAGLAVWAASQLT